MPKTSKVTGKQMPTPMNKSAAEWKLPTTEIMEKLTEALMARPYRITELRYNNGGALVVPEVLPIEWQSLAGVAVKSLFKNGKPRPIEEIEKIGNAALEASLSFRKHIKRGNIKTVHGQLKLTVPEGEDFETTDPPTDEELKRLFPMDSALLMFQSYTTSRIYKLARTTDISVDPETARKAIMAEAFPAINFGEDIDLSHVYLCIALMYLDMAIIGALLTNSWHLKPLGTFAAAMAFGMALPTADIYHAANKQLFKGYASSGLKKRWAKKDQAQARALELWRSGKWASRSECAEKIKTEILDVAKKSGLSLQPTNIARQIKDWIRKAEKPTTEP